MYRYLNVFSRALVALIFVASGAGKLMNFQGTIAMAGGPLPFPGLMIALAALVEIAGGLALLAGWNQQWASLALFLFMIPTTLIYHAAYLGDPAQFQMQLGNVLKNLAIMGGLLKFYVDAGTQAERVIAESPSGNVEEIHRRAS